MSLSFPDPCSAILNALVSAPLAWQTPAQLSTKLSLDIDTISDALAVLDEADWLEPWEMGDALFVTLTPRAASNLGVRLVLIGRSDAMRWASAADLEPEPPRALGRSAGANAMLELVADPDPGPEAAAEAAELAAGIAERSSDSADPALFLARPTILLGLGLTPWPGPREQSEGCCPACRSQPIRESAYCLICDRWGLDHLLFGRSTPRREPSHRRSPAPVRDVESQALLAKAKRKAKRKRKWMSLNEKRGAKRRPRESAASL